MKIFFQNLKNTSARPFLGLIKFSRRVTQNFIADRCTQTAAALTYTSLLSLVPLLAVGFSLLSAFPVFKSLSSDVQSFLFTNFVPASHLTIQKYLLEFTQKASHLTIVGVIFLVITSLLLVETIDKALNDIWKIKQRRRGISKFMAYWAILSLGPMLIGISIAVTSYLVSLPFIFNVTENIMSSQQMLSFMPFALTMLAFILIYVVVPNRYIPLKHGIIGGILGALLFEVAKKSFALYVTEFATYELIYGTLSAIPIFLLWVYLSWMIILIGAEITRSLNDYHQEQDENMLTHCISKNNTFIQAFLFIGHLWQAQRRGELLTLNQLIRLEPHFQDTTIENLFAHLEETHWVHRTSDHCYALSRDVHEATLLDLYKSLSDLLLKPTISGKDNWHQALDEIFEKTNHVLVDTLQVPLYRLYQTSEKEIEISR